MELYVGSDSFPYRYTHLVLNEVQLALGTAGQDSADGKSAAFAARTRALDGLCQGHLRADETAFEDTQRVTLIPVDEWVDDTEKNPWLPSFVLPQDPAILKIINSSRRYLIGIMDDPAAGFDGYQEAAAGVDDRCRRSGPHWSMNTGFNTSTRRRLFRQTQRLRTPSEILDRIAEPVSTSLCCSRPASNISASFRWWFC